MVKDELLQNIHKLHTTEMGMNRIKRNLEIDEDVVKYCCELILNDNSLIERKGKNFYAYSKGIIITVNAYSFTIITAHKK